jgi:hypothetical protein
MKRQAPKLALARETLLHLEADLAQAKGGGGTTTNYWFCVTTTLGPPPSADTNCGVCGTN